MFKAIINSETLGDAIEAVSSIVDEVKISVSETGLELKAADAANVAMVSLKVGPEAFENFKGTPSEMGVDLARLSDILSMASKGEKVGLGLDEENHKLKIDVGSLSYTMSLIDTTAMRKEPEVPKLDLPAHVTLPGGEIRRAVKAAEKVSDHVIFGVSDEGFFMEAKGDIDSLQLKIPSIELLSMKPGEARSLFSLDYLKNMGKAIGKSNEVTLDLGIDYPLMANFKLGRSLEVSYLLAPRVEEE